MADRYRLVLTEDGYTTAVVQALETEGFHIDDWAAGANDPRDGFIGCCDLHGIACEPPSELCCRYCTEVNHPDHPNVGCVLRSGDTGSHPTGGAR